MIKTIKLKHNNKVKTLSKDVILHCEIVWNIAERYTRRYKKLLDVEKLFDEVVDKY